MKTKGCTLNLLAALCIFLSHQRSVCQAALRSTNASRGLTNETTSNRNARSPLGWLADHIFPHQDKDHTIEANTTSAPPFDRDAMPPRGAYHYHDSLVMTTPLSSNRRRKLRELADSSHLPLHQLVGTHRHLHAKRELMPDCQALHLDWVGDGYCDQGPEYNSAGCNWDGGDCCQSTCVPKGRFKCPTSEFLCLADGDSPSEGIEHSEDTNSDEVTATSFFNVDPDNAISCTPDHQLITPANDEKAVMRGIMFDVEAKDDDVTIMGFDINMDRPLESRFRIYSRQGSHKDAEDRMDKWSDLGVYSIETESRVNLKKEAFVRLSVGKISSFFVTQLDDDGINAIDFRKESGDDDSDLLDDVQIEDANLKLFIGTGKKLDGFNGFQVVNMHGMGFSGKIVYGVCSRNAKKKSRSGCFVAKPKWLGDGYCDDSKSGYNTEECDWDGGDCCPETCRSGRYNCPSKKFACRDPSERRGESSDRQDTDKAPDDSGDAPPSSDGGGGGGGQCNQDFLTGDERVWLDKHNQRRRYYHEKYVRGSYIPMRWSKYLQRSSKQYANYLASNRCEDYDHDPNNRYGENLAVIWGTDRIETVMNAWVEEEELDRDEPYRSGHGHMTQALWRASRHVGCAMTSNSECHIYVCRYIKPGNCNRRVHAWLDDMMSDNSPCGPKCPIEDDMGDECCNRSPW